MSQKVYPERSVKFRLSIWFYFAKKTNISNFENCFSQIRDSNFHYPSLKKRHDHPFFFFTFFFKIYEVGQPGDDGSTPGQIVRESYSINKRGAYCQVRRELYDADTIEQCYSQALINPACGYYFYYGNGGKCRCVPKGKGCFFMESTSLDPNDVYVINGRGMAKKKN